MKKPIKLEGIYPALITSLNGDGSLDIPGVKKNVRHCLDNGCAGVVVMGSTGEAVNMSREERIAVIKAAVEESAGKGKVIAGAGAPITSTTLAYVQDAKENGADAALVITPFNNIPNSEGLIKHYTAANEVGIPIILYNLPAHTGVAITMDIFDELIKLPNIIGIKESSGNFPLMANIIRKYGDDVTIFTGCDDLTLPIFSLGAKAAILALANIAPKQVVSILEDVKANRLESARKTYSNLLPIAVIIGEAVNFPATVKEAVKQTGRPAGAPRLPIVPCDSNQCKEIAEALKYAGLI
jgi:4-hydroxy-tetrahydrodipicolinate synthase